MKLLLVLIFSFLCVCQLHTQEPQRPVKLEEPERSTQQEEQEKPSEPQKTRQTRQIELLRAGSMEFDKRIGDDARRVLGNVLFKHEDAYMNCDSAYLYSQTNSLEAFSNIHIQVSDTIDIYGDKLYYDGNTSIAELHGNVKMQDENMVLTTDHLIYDLKENTANYYDGGRIIDQDNVLTSKWGFYYADRKHFFFKDNVKLVNPEYTMDSDTLKYNTLNETAHFFGPTTIISDENTIFCKNGWYDTKNDVSQFNREAYITNKEHSITGDSLFYDRNTGYGKAMMNVEMKDTVQNVIINGHFAEHFEKEGLSVVTKEAVMTVFSENDSLYLHADTLKYLFLDEPVIKEEKLVHADRSLQNNDTSNEEIDVLDQDEIMNEENNILNNDNPQEGDDNGGDDSIEDAEEGVDDEVKEIRKLFAYNRAKFYRTDLQGMSDSIVYSFSDSIIYMYQEPILWSEEHQLTANTIEIESWDNTVEKAHLIDAAFIISQEDADNYNQIKGRRITGFFNENLLYRVDVFGNGETIYYVRNENEELVGINKAISANMTIYIEDNQVQQIIFKDDPEANLFPPEDLMPEERLLRHFKWHINLRPKTKDDIFVWK